MPAARNERQNIFNIDKFRVSVVPDDQSEQAGTSGRQPTVQLNLATATALLEETMALVDKCKHYEQELSKRDLIIRRAVVNRCYDDANTGKRRSSFIRSKGEINDDIKSMLVGEVPRLILSEYESCHFKNRKMDDSIVLLSSQKFDLEVKIKNLGSELARTNSEHRILLEEYQDLAKKF